MPVVHIVLFAFTDAATQEQIDDVSRRMAGLSDQCVHPTTNQKYFKSYGGGKDNSPEGKQGGFTHGFVCEFQNAEDRDYYAFKDPAHMQFVGSLDGLIKDARVIDYEPGVL